MWTRSDVEIAAKRAHAVAKMLVDVGSVDGRAASAEDVLKWYDEMLTNDTISNEAGLIMLTADRECGGKPWFTVYVNVGPAEKRAK